jgi:hypothetical protein
MISSFFKSSIGCFSFSMIFSLLAIFHDLQWTFLKFPPFSVFLAIFHFLKYVFLIFCDFQFSRHIPGATVCISHFSRFSVISSLFKSSSGCFSFSMIFSFLAIFHVLHWTFLKFPPFSVFLANISLPKVSISHFFVIFSFLVIFQVLQCAFSFFTFFSHFVIFELVKWIFLIFHDFQFSCHIPCPTVDISKFSTFFNFSRHISRPIVCISHFP